MGESMLDFTGKVALVTGAGSGIGAAVAEGFGRRGAHVVVHYGHNREGAEKVASAVQEAGGAASVVSADLSSPAGATRLVDEVVAAHGRLDVLVNNAGDLLGRTPIAEMTDGQFARVMDLNTTSVFAACRQAVPVMQRQGAGAIVNVTSVAARTGGAGGSVAYATAKGAVSTFTRGLAKEVARDGIRVNAIAPGIIVTPFHERNTSGEQMAAMVAGIPMGRSGTPEECVGTVLFLADDGMSGYVTGQVIEINGGQLTP
ncbi:SDR family oxidoreductase [Pseudonocardia zijingensis]|jgi:3-oxoacyl-[acyl-carrier protein] reductase|uniref:SDR family oxidoreductase n=2 Tax=Pseudonocardia zijingensis TaxID=153376 RepID=A0ABN1N9C5_9PSEU